MIGYQLIISLDVCLCLWFALSRAKKFATDEKQILNICLVLMLSSFIGARAMHVLYEYPNLYLADPIRVLQFWQGGFVFYGGAILATLCGYLYLVVKKIENKGSYFDFFAPVASLGHAIGRLGCLYAGCCYGKFCELPWAVNSADEFGIFKTRHPTQIYMALWEIAIFLILLNLEKKRPISLKKPGRIFIFWVALHSLGRLIVEQYREDFRGPEIMLSVSSWLSIGLLLLCLSVFAYDQTERIHRK